MPPASATLSMRAATLTPSPKRSSPCTTDVAKVDADAQRQWSTSRCCDVSPAQVNRLCTALANSTRKPSPTGLEQASGVLG